MRSVIAGDAPEALGHQSRRPDRVVVAADNCSDRTAEIAREWGYEVFETTANEHKKAGALNQVLSLLLPEMGPTDVVLGG